MPRIESIKSAVLNIFKGGHCGGCTGTRRSDHLRQRSPHRKIKIASACVTFVRSKDSAAASVAAKKEPFTHAEVREMAEWLVEAIARGDLQTATYALKACLVVPWPRGISVSLCQEVLDRLWKADRLDWDRQLADFYRITAGYSNGEQKEFVAADVAFAGKWLLGRYRHLTGRDPLLAHPAHRDDPVHGQCRAVLDKAGESFAEIRRYLIEHRRQKMSDGDVDEGSERLEMPTPIEANSAGEQDFERDCKRIRTFTIALERLTAWADGAGVDAVTILADELKSQPERIRNGYVRLHAAVDAAVRRLVDGNPAYQAPIYHDLARDLVTKLQLAPASPDESLVAAARQVLQPSSVKRGTDRTSEIDDALERLVRLTESTKPVARGVRGTTEPELAFRTEDGGISSRRRRW